MVKGLRPGFPSGLQVLVVHGSELDDQLKQLGYAATSFATAREAAVFLSQGQGTPDIILAEARSVHVGDGDSQWLLSQARARSLPLVLMSDSGSTGEVMKGIELGAVDYLEKPVSPLKLRNIWQHVVRKMMAGSTADEKPAFFSCKPEAQPAAGCENVGSGPGTPGTPSPAISMDHGQHSTLTSHSSKCFEAEASSCSENTKCRRVLRSADTSAESSGKAAPAPDEAADAAKPPSTLSRAASCSGTAPPTRARSKRAARGDAAGGGRPASRKADPAGSQPAAAAAAAPLAGAAAITRAASFPLLAPVAVPLAGWQPTAGCVWGTPLMPAPMGWQQQVGMPASFMPVDSSPLGAPAALDAGQAASGGKGAAGTTLAAVATLPTSLPSMASFTSSLSCTTELDLPFSSAADLSAAAAASPSFGGSCDDSLHSDFTDLMLPNDLDLDLMFGDGMEALLGGGDAAGMCGGLPAPADKPPIGLCLRKSQSLLDLINARLQKEASPASGAAAIAAVPEAEATASGAVPMQCA